MNLCLRGKAVAVALPGAEIPPPPVPEDSTLRGRAQELHRHLSRMREPIIAPRDQLIINLDFDMSLVDDPADLPGTPDDPELALSPAAAAPNGRRSPLETATAGPASGGTSPTRPLPRDDAASGPTVPSPRAAAPSPRAAAQSPKAPGPSQRPTGAPARPAASSSRPTAPSPRPAAPQAPSPRPQRLPQRPQPPEPQAPERAPASDSASRTEDGSSPTKRGYVRVKSVRPPQGLEWTHSRKCLEVLITEEKANRENSTFKTHEQRLRERLERLNLEMLIVMGDGNCQFRSVSNELYGTQDHHSAIRRQAVEYIVARREAFEAFLGEDFDEYVRQMARNGTWGDELTLRAVCDSFGIIVHVVTSEADHWYLTYEPETRKLDREIFLTYIAPIHYNSIRRQSSLKTMALTVSRSFRKLGSGHLGGGRTSSGPLPSSAGPSSPVGVASPSGVVTGGLGIDDGPDDPSWGGDRGAANGLGFAGLPLHLPEGASGGERVR